MCERERERERERMKIKSTHAMALQIIAVSLFGMHNNMFLYAALLCVVHSCTIVKKTQM